MRYLSSDEPFAVCLVSKTADICKKRRFTASFTRQTLYPATATSAFGQKNPLCHKMLDNLPEC
jgi:hypothetical protein